MSTLQERFQILRARRPDITNADLARLTGAKAPSVGDWFNGNTKSLKGDTAAKVADAYSVSAAWVATGQGPMTQNVLPDGYRAILASDADAVVTTTKVGTAKITRPTAMSPETEKRLTRFLAVLYQLDDERRGFALSAATEVLLDHLPPPPTE